MRPSQIPSLPCLSASATDLPTCVALYILFSADSQRTIAVLLEESPRVKAGIRQNGSKKATK